MTVADLIRRLSRCGPDDEVTVSVDVSQSDDEAEATRRVFGSPVDLVVDSGRVTLCCVDGYENC